MKDIRQETYIINYIAVHAFILNEEGGNACFAKVAH